MEIFGGRRMVFIFRSKFEFDKIKVFEIDEGEKRLNRPISNEGIPFPEMSIQMVES